MPPSKTKRSPSTKRRAGFLPGLEVVLIALILGVAINRIVSNPAIISEVIPENVYELRYDRIICPDKNGELLMRTFLPEDSERQKITRLEVASGLLDYSQVKRRVGIEATWEGSSLKVERRVGYKVQVVSREVRYEIDPDVQIGVNLPKRLQHYTEPDERVRWDAPELQNLIETLSLNHSPESLKLLEKQYAFVHEQIQNAPDMNETKVATTLKLKTGNALSKSALFAALTRANGHPTRILKGYLTHAKSAPVHYWNEVYIGNRWVPFCTTFGYFAEIPEHFLVVSEQSEGARAEVLAGKVLIEKTNARKFLSPRPDQQASASILGGSSNMLTLLKGLGLDAKASGLFIMFPLVALVIASFRTIVGLVSFGVFMPMLIAAACCYTGLATGLTVFSAVVIIAAFCHIIIDRFHIHKVPRISAVITVISLIMIGMLLLEESGLFTYFGFLAMFPVIILSFTADQLHEFIEKQEWSDLLKAAASTLLIIIVCHWLYSSAFLRSLFGTFPELILLVLIAQLWIGRWTSMRLSEYLRFQHLIKANRGKEGFNPEQSILGLNARDRDIIRKLNLPKDIRTADNKILTKQALEALDIPTAATLFTVEKHIDLETLKSRCRGIDEMVIKPTNGYQGLGILLLRGRDGEDFLDTGKNRWTMKAIHRHICFILNGNYSRNQRYDTVLIEELFHPDTCFDPIAAGGIPDIRVLLIGSNPVAAMLRLPTRKSEGKSNLHMGAVGVEIDIETGKCGNALHLGKETENHPDTGIRIKDFQVPEWDRVLTVAKDAQAAIPLGYTGIDICIDKNKGPVVLEVNAHPGIEIQNVRKEGLKPSLSSEMSAELI